MKYFHYEKESWSLNDTVMEILLGNSVSKYYNGREKKYVWCVYAVDVEVRHNWSKVVGCWTGWRIYRISFMVLSAFLYVWNFLLQKGEKKKQTNKNDVELRLRMFLNEVKCRISSWWDL